jgi:hypothetical protein
MALFERVFARDVADEYVEPSVAIEVAEVDPHPFERITAKDLGVRYPECLRPTQRDEARSPGVDRLCRSRSGPKSFARYSSGRRSPSRSAAPTASVHPRLNFGVDRHRGLFEAHRRLGSGRGALPQKQPGTPPLSALDIECCIDSRWSIGAAASRIRALSGK